MGSRELPKVTDPRLLRLAPGDNVCVTTRTIEAGEPVMIGGMTVRLAQRVPTGHKVAVARIAPGEAVFKYGAPIGSASREIHPGQHVHTHNLQSGYLPTYTLDGTNPFLGDA